MKLIRFLVLSTACLSSFAQATSCSKWSEPQKVGLLDTKILNEASGLSLSKQFPNRMYSHNDSKAIGAFYMTDLTGAQTQEIRYTNDKVRDVEDIDIGPCDSGQCIFLGDIGDNFFSRKSIDVWILPETETFQDVMTTARKVTVQYPDGPHNAESLAVHPQTGDVYILTKEADEEKERRSYPAKLFRLPRTALATQGFTLEFLGTIDLPWMNYNYGLFGGMATSMDISPDGKNLMVLTYDNAVEISLDKVLSGPFDSRSWKQNTDYRIINLRDLLSQQEAVGYSLDGNSIYFDSEFDADAGDTESPIYSMQCLERVPK